MNPVLRTLSPELSHSIAITALKLGLVPKQRVLLDAALVTNLWNLNFKNPVGLAAGFDKNAEVAIQMLECGFGFVEIGSVTPNPQPGNPRPRIYRFNEDQAIINRLGFNNKGSIAVKESLSKIRSQKPAIIGINLGQNKNTKDIIDDYQLGLSRLGCLADYIVINVSSPNTPGLRALQQRKALDTLLQILCKTLSDLNLSPRPPLLVKVAPDLTSREKINIAEVIMNNSIDGLIATNTTISRPLYLTNEIRSEVGGLSGQPLFEMSTQVVSDFFRLTEGKIPIIGVGGISSGKQAYKKIRAGASLVQLYSAFVFNGPGLVNKISEDLLKLLKADGIKHVSDAVGLDA